MTLKDVIIPMLWVGWNHPFWYVHPVVAFAAPSNTPATAHCDLLLQEMYELPELGPELDEMITLDLDESEPDTWYNHIHLIEVPHETAC
ncbi:hypothetical protein [Pantoea eucrina]|uniref:hypothetical protein n=1 Tax=Pantoea eucrina TaxID=472693 RepID=UPI00080F56FD|nr:hypothetical protein [Pantoea eucrina]